MPPKSVKQPKATNKSVEKASQNNNVVEIQQIINKVEEPNADEPVYSDEELSDNDNDDDITEEEKELLRKAEELKIKMKLKQQQKDYNKFIQLQGVGILKEEVKRQIDMITKFINDNGIYDIVIDGYDRNNHNNINQIIEDITISDDDGMSLNGDYDKYLRPLYEEIIKPKIEPKQITEVKPKKEKKEDGKKRVSVDKSRPKTQEDYQTIFTRDTIIHYNTGGHNEYCVFKIAHGLFIPSNAEGEIIDSNNVFKTLNAFCKFCIECKNAKNNTNRSVRIDAYNNTLYKNDDGVWCSNDDIKMGNVLTK
jgi:hypothetical protein